MHQLAFLVPLVSLATSCASLGVLRTDSDTTTRWMIEKERAWANMACGGTSIAQEILADDFQGTAPKGVRYGKPKGDVPEDPNTVWSTDCRLDSADVRFFSADVAVAYGSESKTVPLAGGAHERRCLVWSDMWLRRNGKWQIIAVQDNRVDCPAR